MFNTALQKSFYELGFRHASLGLSPADVSTFPAVLQLFYSMGGLDFSKKTVKGKKNAKN